MSTISTNIYTQVVIGSANYPSPLTITNTGAVKPGYPSHTSDYGVTAVSSNTAGVTLNNNGIILGALSAPGGVGGIGVDLTASATVNNYNSLYGGIDGGRGNYLGGSGGEGLNLSGGSLNNYGKINGGSGFRNHSGGVGVNVTGGTVINKGIIVGGSGYGAGNGAAGIQMGANTQLTNSGQINGGVGGEATGTSGSAGVILAAGATLMNNGFATITGGDGGGGYSPNSGGAGVDLAGSGATVSNAASIAGGGFGGSSLVSPGAGVYVTAGTALTNTSSGFIQGGPGGAGGVGVLLDGGTVTTSGHILGGNPASGIGSGDAVQFGGVASTLAVEPGAVFNGQVEANATVNDVLKLVGIESKATPITLGTQFTNFSTLTFIAGAAWTVDVGAGAAPSGGLTINGFTTADKIDVTNLAPAQVVSDFTAGTHTLSTANDGTLHFASGPFSGEAFLFSNDGSGGTDVTLVVGSALSSVLTSTVALGGSAHPSPLTISNAGGVTPTLGGASGLVSTIARNTLTNHGVIKGGAGSTGSAGSIGGIGVDFVSGATFINTGSISGGAGGSGTTTTGGHGGSGAVLDAGTLTNRASIRGGAGGSGTTKGGSGGSAVVLNGGTLITSGTIVGGAGGSGPTLGGAGDSVLFGTAASTLVVDPGAVFSGQVLANNAHDVLELSGTQSGGTSITLGAQFSTFSELDFASGAAWTADATLADLIAHPLTIDGFTTADTLALANLAGAKLSFNTTSDVLTLTKGATTVNLQFDSAFSGDHFVLTANGTAANLTLVSGASAPLAALAHEPRNFVGAEHCALLGDPSSFGGYSFGREPPMNTAWAAHGFSSDPFTDHGVAHALCVGSHG